jgi:mono/diheme cytochrome c family protein
MSAVHARSLRATAIVVVWIAGAAVSAGQTHPRDPEWVAPAEYDSMINPLAARPETAAGGAKIFAQRCASCHGRDGRGTRKAPALVDPAVRDQSDGAVFWKISSGNAHTGMPAFSFLPELQRWQLVLHVRALSNAGSAREGRLEIGVRPAEARDRRLGRSALFELVQKPNPDEARLVEDDADGQQAFVVGRLHRDAAAKPGEAAFQILQRDR